MSPDLEVLNRAWVHSALYGWQATFWEAGAFRLEDFQGPEHDAKTLDSTVARFPLSTDDIAAIEASVDAVVDKLISDLPRIIRRHSPKTISFDSDALAEASRRRLSGADSANASAVRLANGERDASQWDVLVGKALTALEEFRQEERQGAVARIATFLANAKARRVRTSLAIVLGGEHYGLRGQAIRMVDKIFKRDAAPRMSLRETLVVMSARTGVADPAVFFIPVRDKHLCSLCRRLHLCDDGRTPRCWYLSEVGPGIGEHPVGRPHEKGAHDHCRCSMAGMMPGYGFDADGMVTYIAHGHSEIDRQRSDPRNG